MPRLVAVTVSLPAFVHIGASVQATVAVAFDNGTTTTVADNWFSDNPPVATVTVTGLVNGVSNGHVTIVAVAGGQTGQQNIRVLPNYSGVWTGTFVTTSCDPFPTPAYTHHCAGMPTGTTGTIIFTFMQTDETLVGQLSVNGLIFSGFVSVIGGDGSTVVDSTNLSPPYLNETTWRFNSTQVGQASGTLRWVRRGTGGLIGGAEIGGTITSLSRQD